MFIGLNYLLRHKTYYRHWRAFLFTFIHESIHSGAALLAGHLPLSQTVNIETGAFRYQKQSDWFQMYVYLLPYVVAPGVLLLALFRPYVTPSAGLWYDGLMGFGIALHALRLRRQTGFHQTDLKTIGREWSVAFISIHQIWFWSLILSRFVGLSLWEFSFVTIRTTVEQVVNLLN